MADIADRASCARVCEAVLRVCGGGPVALIGDAPLAVMEELLRSGLPVVARTHSEAAAVTLAGSCGTASVCAFDPHETFPGATVVVYEGPPGSGDEAAARMLSAALASCGTLVLAMRDATYDGSRREWWERAAIGSGFRRHPAYFDVVEYGPSARDYFVCPMLKVPESIISGREVPAGGLPNGDLSREVSRRSDAHLFRYSFVRSFIRPGDRVLDWGCGCGHGSHVIASASTAAEVVGRDPSAAAMAYAGESFVASGLRFEIGDTCDLSGIPDSSFDIVISFGSLERVPDPAIAVAEAFRVLKPGGRFVAGIGSGGVGLQGGRAENGNDRLLDGPQLPAEIASLFLIEAMYAQDAGEEGASNSRKSMRAVATDAGSVGDFVVAVGMKDPTTIGAALPDFVDSIYPQADRPSHLVEFARDFENPWLMRGLFGIGVRCLSREGRQAMAERVCSSSSPGSADVGAALCVLGYGALTEGNHGQRTALAERLLAYSLGAPANPHQMRWRVSARFLHAQLMLAVGRRDEAENSFLAVVGFPWSDFSPTLATNVVEAAFMAGSMAVARGDVRAARAAWTTGLDACRLALRSDWREFVGSDADPVPDPLAETMAVLDNARKCAEGLRLTSNGTLRRHDWWLARRNAGADRRAAALRELELAEAAAVGRLWAQRLKRVASAPSRLFAGPTSMLRKALGRRG